MIGLFGRLEDRICKTLQSVAFPGLVLPLRVEDVDLVQETFKLSRPGPVLFVVMRPLNVYHGAIQFPLLVIILRGAGLIRVDRLLILLLISGVDSCFLNQGVFVGDCQHLFGRPGILYCQLVDHGRVHESFLEEHDNGFIVDLRNDVSLVAKVLDKSQWQGDTPQATL
jgi:hypothetical protein